MHTVTPIFARLINPGVVLSPKLQQMIFTYDQRCREQTELDDAITTIRDKQLKFEDKLAETLAEDEFHRCQSGQITITNEDEFLKIFRKYFGKIFDELASKQERKIYLAMDLRKLKLAIEKDIATANQQMVAASND